ncbi:t-SNARE affecting a late Golgi compartment protein, partial [Lachnellula suecica]
LLSAHRDLTAALSTLTEDLADLTASVRAVQSDPYKYGLEIDEVARRQRLLEEVGGEVEDMRDELSKHSNANHAQNANNSRPIMGDGFEEGEGDDNYAEFEHQQQQQMMAEQDTQLDSVFHTVGNLRQQASDMGRELEEQGEMLDETDRLADRVGGRLSTGMKRMGEVVRANEDGLSSCCIGGAYICAYRFTCVGVGFIGGARGVGVERDVIYHGCMKREAEMDEDVFKRTFNKVSSQCHYP